MTRLRGILRLAGLVCALITCTLHVAAQEGTNKMTFTTIRNGSATKDWTTDTSSAQLFGSNVLEIDGYFPTGRTDIPYQRLVIKISGFTGKGDYADGQLSASYFEDLFQSKIYKTSFINGTVNIKTYAAQPLSVSATFNFSFTSNPPPPTNSFSTAVINGKVEVNVSNKLIVSAEPLANDKTKPVKGTQGSKVKFKLFVKDKDDSPVAGADIYETSRILGTTDVKVGTTDASGTYQHVFKVPEDQEPDLYPLKYTAKKDKFVDSDPFTVNVKIASSRYYYYKCAGLPIYIFDAGEGKIWKGEDGKKTISSTGTTLINSFLAFDGTVTIDTSEGAEKFTGSGRLYIPNVESPSSNSSKEYDLFKGSTPALELSCTNLFDKGLENISSWLSKVMDVDLKITKMRFTNQDEVATGVTLEGKLSAGEKQLGQCNDKDAQYGVTLEGGITITTAGLKDLKFALKDVGMGPGACLKECGFTYTDNPVSTVVFTGNYTSKTFGGIQADLSWKNKFEKNPITFGLKVTKTLATCKPIPETPLCLKSVTFDGSCSDRLELIKFGVGATIVSDEQILKDKYNFTIPGLEQLAELTGSGTYEAPFKLTLTGTTNLLKIPDIGGKARPWQITATETKTLDVSTNTFSITGDWKMGHLGGIASFLESNSKLVIDWTSGFDITSQASGKMTLPELSDDLKKKPFVKNILKYLPTLPAELGAADYRLHNAYIRANIDLRKNAIPQIREMGGAHVIVNMGASSLWDCFDFGSGYVPLVGKSSGSANNTIQSVQAGSQAAKASQSFDVVSSMQKVLCFLSSNGVAPASSMVDPDGKTFTTTSTDSSVVMYDCADHSQTMWALRSPKIGRWTLLVVNPKSTDSVDVYQEQAPRAFAVNTTVQNRQLKATWDGSAEDASATVELYLDTDNKGTDGVLIGEANAKTGSFNYTLSDTLSECSYFLYATVIRPNDFATAYAPTEFSTSKSILAPPQNILANANQMGHTSLSWSESPDPNTAGYFIFVRDLAGNDSLYAAYASDITSTTLQIDQPIGKSILMQSFDENGFKGCRANAQTITVGVEDDFLGGTAGESPLSIVPNPGSGFCSLRLVGARSSIDHVELFDVLGQRVKQFSLRAVSENLLEAQFSVADLPSGNYMVQVQDGNIRFNTLLNVVH